MKKLFFIAFFGCFFTSVGTSEPFPIDNTTMIKKHLIKAYNAKIDKLLFAVRFCESGMNDFAIGKAGDVGPLQIIPIRLADYNRRTGKKYSHSDCFKWEVSKEIFLFYANQIGYIPHNFEEICRKWNRSSQWQDEKGQSYWNRISKHLKSTI